MTAMMIEAAARAVLLAIVVGAGLRVLRVTNVPARKAAWSLVLVASLAMPFLMRWSAVTGMAKGIGWVVPIHRSEPVTTAIAQMPAAATSFAAPSADRMRTAVVPVARHARRGKATSAAMVPAERNAAIPNQTLAGGRQSARVVPASTKSASRQEWQWPPVGRLIAWTYLAVGGALLLRLLWGLGAAVWLWARAEEISPLDVPEEHVRVSNRIPSPVTIGSGIVLPGNYQEWDRKKLRAVLAHERSHVRQMDFYLQLMAGIYTAVFWFSPLGWWLKGTLSHLGEAISDRAGLEAAASRSDYAGVLLEFAAMTRSTLPGVAMARKGNLSRRVDRMLNEKLFQRAFSEGRRRAAVSLLLVPAALFAATALVRVPRVAAQTATAAQKPLTPASQDPNEMQMPAAQQKTGQSTPPETPLIMADPETLQNPATPPLPPAASEPVVTPDVVPAPQAVPVPQGAPAPAEEPATPQVAPAPPEPPSNDDMPMTLDMPEVIPMPGMKMVAPMAPKMLLDAEGQSMMALGLGDSFGLTGPGESFFLAPNGNMHGYAYYFSSNGDSWAIVDGPGKNFSMGSGKDKRQLDLAQRMARGPFLWFSHEGKSYIVDDPAVVAQIQSLYAPMKDLARRQEALAVQRRVMARMDAETARQQHTNANVKIPDLSKEMADAEAALNSLKSEQGQMLSEEKLAEMQSKLAEMEARLGSLQARSAMQNDFAERMHEMSEQQRQMGEQQRQLGEQEKQLATQAQQQVRSIIQECLRNGKAAPVK